jgi:sugar phosphate isomerase/epimerase
MPELKIGIALASLRQPLKQALHTASRLGATGVEIDARNGIRPRELSDTGRRQLRKMMDDLNLRVAAVRFQTRRGYDSTEDLERRIDATKEAMAFAYRLGAPVVINAVGRVPALEGDDADPEARSTLKNSLSDLARHGQHVGSMLACETGTEPVERLVGLLDELAERSIGINLNPANLIVNGYYDLDTLASSAMRVLAVTARDAVRDRARGRGVEVQLGRGMAEFPQLLAILEELPYRGWFTIDRERAADPLFEIGQSVSFLREL